MDGKEFLQGAKWMKRLFGKEWVLEIIQLMCYNIVDKLRFFFVLVYL